MNHIMIVACYCLACLGAGLFVFQLMKIDKRKGRVSALPYLASAFLFGQAILANVWLLSALHRLFSSTYIIIVSSVLGLVGLYLISTHSKSLVDQVRYQVNLLLLIAHPFQLIVGLTIATILLYSYSADVLHPMIDADGFYLLYSKIISASERLASLHIWPLASQIGLLTELHFAALMSLSGLGAAKLFMWPVGLSLAVILFSIAGVCGLNAMGKWISLIILFTSTAFIFLIADGKTDMMGAALGLCAFYWLIVAEKPVSWSVLSLVGLLCGFAIMAKNTYLICLAPPIMILAGWRFFYEDRGEQAAMRVRALLSGLTIIGFFIILAVLPNMIKNNVLFHEPFAPFYYLSGVKKTHLDQVWHRAEVTKHILLMYPLSLSFGVHNGQYGNLSPLVIAFLPLIGLLKRPLRLQNHALMQMTVVGLSGMLLWILFFPSFHAPRYFLVNLVLLIPLAAWIAGLLLNEPETPRMIRRAVLFCLLFSVSLMLFSQCRLVFKDQVGGLDWGAPVSPIEGLHYGAINKANQMIPTGSRVFLYGGNTVYLRGDLLQGLSSMSEVEEHAKIQSSKDRWTYLFTQGFSYVMIKGNPYVRDVDVEELFFLADKPDWLNIKEYFSGDGIKIYQLSANDRYHRPALMLKQIQYPAWDIAKTQ